MSARARRPASTPTTTSRPMSPTSPMSSIMEAIRAAGVRIGIDPLGGAAVHYWQPIIERYKIAATVVNDAVDPTFRFMTVDWDGKIRMDCSSPYAMTRLIAMRDKFDIAFANDTDADRHGIVCPSSGLMNPNCLSRRRDRLSLCQPPGLARRQRRRQDRRLQRHDRPRHGEARAQAHRSAGGLQMVQRRPDRRIAGLRRRGKRRRLVPAARRVGVDDRQGRTDHGPARRRDHAREPATIRTSSTSRSPRDLGKSFYQRIDAPASREAEEARLAKPRSRSSSTRRNSAGEPIEAKLTRAPGNNAADRRDQGGRQERLVCRAPIGNRGRLQDLRGKLPQRGSSETNSERCRKAIGRLVVEE